MRARYLVAGAPYIIVGEGLAPPASAKSGVQRITSRYHPRCQTDKETPLPFLIWECGSLLSLFRLLLPKTSDAGRRAATAPSSLCGNPLRTMRCRDDLPAGRRLLVCGIASRRPDANRCEGMLVPEMPACQDRSFTKLRQAKRSLKLQSICTVGPVAVAATCSRRLTTARATL